MCMPLPHLTGPHPFGQGDSYPQPVPLRPHADVPCGGGWTSDGGCVHVGPQQQYALGLGRAGEEGGIACGFVSLQSFR